MAYYRPGDRVGGYPLGPELGEDGPSGLGGGFRPAGGYGERRGYGGSSYEYERGRPVGGGYAGGAGPEFYGAERPGGYGYGREEYGPMGYDQGYPRRRPEMGMQPPLEFLEAQPSDLGMGLRDAGKIARPGRAELEGYGMAEIEGYGRPELGGYGRPELGGYGRPGLGGLGRSEMGGYGGGPGYGGGGMFEEDEVRRLKKELEHERREKHELEAVAAGAVGFGFHERREKKEEEEEEEEPKKEKRRHHFFSRD